MLAGNQPSISLTRRCVIFLIPSLLFFKGQIINAHMVVNSYGFLSEGRSRLVNALMRFYSYDHSNKKMFKSKRYVGTVSPDFRNYQRHFKVKQE